MSTTPLQTTQQSDGVFSIPSHVEAHKDELDKKVSAVSKTWKWGMFDEKTLTLIIPGDQASLGLSKMKFVDFLDFCDVVLGLERIIAVFRKDGVTPEDGFPKTLRYIGFRLISPEELPEHVDTENFFGLRYII